MSGIFLTAAVIMSVLAIFFVAAPLNRRKHLSSLIGATLSIPLFAASIYSFIGSPQAAAYDVSPHVAPKVQTSSRDKSVGSVANMVDGLANRLAENPDDGKGWLLLARSYEHLGRMSEASAAYDKAAALGEYDKRPATPGEESTAISGTQLKGSVSLSASAQEIVLPTDRVFVFARAVDGPPMPVAVLQHSVSDLPLEFTLDDSLAMSADAKLSTYDQVTVTARVSRAGAATEALKGLEARSGIITLADNQHLDLIIE